MNKNSAAKAAATDTAGAQPANIDPATEFAPSGAPIQPTPDVDPSHPAVDNDPRAGTTVDQNKIDFNDPTLSGQEAVEQNLAKQAAEKPADAKG